MIKKAILLLFLAMPAYPATYYLATTGVDASATGTIESPFGTLQHAFTHMSGGDTLIVRDGTYTGASNIFDYNHCLPNGTAGAWSILKAENDGAAIFDGQGARNMFNVDASDGQNRYWQIEGIVVCNSYGTGAISISGCNYVKFLRCGAYGAQWNSATFSLSRQSNHCLAEGCYAYGNGRYKFLVYQSSYTILRDCVARFDDTDATDNCAFFSIYSVWRGEVQNCIAIDGDQNAAWSGNEQEHAGCFYLPATDAPGQYINFTNCLGLNSHIGAIGVSGNYNSNDVTFSNCAFWDIESENDAHSVFMIYMRGHRASLLNCTFGDLSHEYVAFNSYSDDPNATTMKNNIIYHAYGGTLLNSIETEDYNNFYMNESTGTIGANSLTLNPIWSESNTTGALKYITRTETGNSLSTSGDGGVQIGANAMTLIGAPGTLWGETGYNTDTGVSMWPFPNEALIKTKMATYTGGGINGARGFCATGTQLNGVDDITLTSYIWEYLGNQMPTDIYNTEPDVSSPTISGITETVYATSATIVWTTNESANSRVDYGATTGYGSNVTGAAYSTSHSLEITGLTAETLYHYKITTADSTGNTTESADGDFTTTAESEPDPEDPPAGSIGITIQGITITGGITIGN